MIELRTGTPDAGTTRIGESHIASRILEVRNVCKSYSRSNFLGKRTQVFHALRDVSFSINQGQISAVVGESGSGKTTLARILLGLEQPDSGAVFHMRKDFAAMAAGQRRSFHRSIQVVLQDPASSLNPRMRVGAILSEPMSAVGVPRQEFSGRIAEVLEQVGLPVSSISRYPHQFSGGQRQRIAIARAIIVRPSLVIMDEPVSSLDVSVAAQIIDLIRQLQSDLHMAVLFISHNLGHVWQIAQDVAVMRHGEIVEQGPVDSVFSSPSNAYTRQLLDAVPRIAFGDE